MRLWPRRKVIYTWDDNFAPVVECLPGPFVDQDFLWYCPDNAYIRLTSVFGWFQSVAGIRPSMLMTFHLHRGDFLRFQIDLTIGIINPGERAFVLYGASPRITTTSSAHTRQGGLPIPCHMIPGDTLEIHTTTVIAGDNFHDMCISYDRWELA